jgi:acyl-CoA thioesterase
VSYEDSRESDIFDTATAVTQVDDGLYAAELAEDYAVLGNPHGGYLVAVVANAAAHHLGSRGADHPHCLAASASFVRPAKVGSVEIALDVHRQGSRISHVRASLLQDGEVAVDLLLSLGRLEPDAPVRYEVPCDVELPALEECLRRPAEGIPGVSIAIMDRVDLRLDAATAGFAEGVLSDTAEIRGWLRLADGRRMDPLGLLFALDVLPPATFAIGSIGWVPTVQFNAYIRALPAEGWLIARQRARSVSSGLVDQVCEIWDADGHVVGQATQLAMVRFAD